MENIEKLNHYSFEEVIETYNIQPVLECQTLKEWVDAPIVELSPIQLTLLSELPAEYKENYIGWNEEELKMNMLSVIFRIANVNQKGIVKTFYERRLSGKVQDKNISVVVDCMIAKPTQAIRPSTPYFFLQEAPTRPSPKGKEQENDNHDPEGQMLAAMILAQELNQDGKPLYGCWLQGKNWNFTTLMGRDYCVSKQFDATDMEDLHQIVFILKKLKDLILNR